MTDHKDRPNRAAQWHTSLFLCTLITCLMATTAFAQAEAESSYQYDAENAEDINYLCAGCHGEFGQGGGDGEYPRLAGLPEKYLAKQLRAFINKTRHSIVMLTYANEREMPEADLLDISRYHSELQLLTKMPDVAPDTDSYQILLIAQRVVNVARFDGDFENGELIYNRACKRCHGLKGVGRGSTPQLAGQFTDYLRIQIEQFRSRERINKKMDKYLDPLTPEEIESVLAYLSIADD
jgi:cytochrome c553